MKKIFVTGDPGIGKTTLIGKIVYELKSRGLSIGGVLTRDMREKGVRIGFQIVSLSDGVIGTLSSVKVKTGPKIGKYKVNLNDLKNIFAASILYSIDYSDVIVCDEVGPMELISPDARRAIVALLDSDKPIIGSVHKRLKDPIIDRITGSDDIKVYEITFENRELLHKAIVEEIMPFIK